MVIALLVVLAAQSAIGRVNALSPREDRSAVATPTPTMVAEPAAMAIASFDADGDGRTSRPEMAAGLARGFAAVDTARAGRLRPIAYADWALRYLGSANALPSLMEADGDGDDAVSLAELQAAFAAIFDRLDKDRDGFASRAELLTVRSGEGRGADGSRRRGGGGRPR